MSQATEPRVSLWRYPDFLLLWGGQSVSQVGSQVTVWALPFAAIYALRASPAQVGLLAAAGTLPPVLFGLVAGALADRLPRRAIMIWADVGRALLIGSIPLAALFGRLSMGQLYFAAFFVGCLSILFDVAYRSYLPSIIRRGPLLLAANGRLEASASFAEMAGPGFAGALVQLVSAPFALLADAFSFVVSVVSLAFMHGSEAGSSHTDAEAPTARAQLRQQIADGLRVVLRHPLLRPLALASGFFNLFDSMLFAMYVLYLTRILHFSAALSGGVLVLGGLGGMVGALLTGWITRHLGVGRALLGGVFVAGIAELVLALAGGPLWLKLLMVAGGEASVQAGAVLYRVNHITLRQTVVADKMQGRVNATIHVISSGAAPLGALVAAGLSTSYGVRATVVLAGLGTLLAFLCVLFSPVRRLQDHTESGKP